MDSTWEYRLELRHVRAFIGVAEELHFGRAATRLHIAQPALTKQIQQLELTLGVKLLDRSSRSVSLTPAGAAFLDEARRTLEQTERAVDAARRSARGETGVLRIGFSASAPNGRFAHVIRDFRDQYPDVRLDLHELWSAQQLEALLAERIDLGFANGPAADSPLLHHQLLQEDPLLAAVQEGDPLAERERVHLRELADRSFITFPRATAPAYFDQQIAACRRVGFSPHVVQEVMEIPAALSLVAAGLGITLLPDNVRTLRRKGVAYVALADGPSLSTVIVWRRGNESAALQRLLDVAGAYGPQPLDAVANG